FQCSPISAGAGSGTGSNSYSWRLFGVESEISVVSLSDSAGECMDAIRTRITFGRVTKSRAAEKRRRIFKSSEWDLEEPAAFARIARSPVELALITGVVIRIFRAVVLTHGNATSSYLFASLVLGKIGRASCRERV